MSYRHRQRSFFNQNHSEKNEKPWQVHNDANEFLGRSRPGKHTSIKPPIKPSLESKSKLEAFTFALQEDRKHESPIVDGENKENPLPESPAMASVNVALTPKSQEKANGLVKEVPKTPAGRLALADLLGDANFVAVGSNVGEFVPGERVIWDTTRPIPKCSQSLLPLTRRGKKRARSSSPLSSPRQTSPQAASADLIFDFQSLNRSLKTPDSGVRTLGSAVPPSALAHLFETSSPRPNEDGELKKAANALSRSLSCGMDWPTSVSKRRKTTRSTLYVKNDRSPDVQPKAGGDQPKKSRVSMLLEKVQDGLAKGPGASGAAPAHFNLKVEVGAVSSRPTSPLAARGSQVAQLEITEAAIVKSEEIVQQQLSGSCGSSEYGDFDDDDLIQATADQSLEPSAVVAPELPLFHMSKGKSNHTAQTAAQPTNDEDDDDFGDLVEEDLEIIMAQHVGKVASVSHQIHSKATEYFSSPAFEPIKKFAGKDLIKNKLEDEYGSLEEEDLNFLSPESSGIARPSSQLLPSKSQVPRKAIQRYVVISVPEDSQTSTSNSQSQKIITVKDKADNPLQVILRSSWAETECFAGDYIHLIGDIPPSGAFVVDNDHGMIILHPDYLLSATVVADSFNCKRRAVLQDRVKATNEASQPQIYGHILHELFQEAIKNNKWDFKSLATFTETIVRRYIESIYDINLSLDEAIEHVQSKIPDLINWADKFISAKPKPGALMQGSHGSSINISVNKLLDVEEHVWSPLYGLKGNIDATTQVASKDGLGVATATVPLEVKTGKNKNVAHIAQTALYNLLLSDRYDVEIMYGVIYYMESAEMVQVPNARHKICDMIRKRNQLAVSVKNRFRLPEMERDAHKCNNCYAKTPCFTYHKLMEDGDGNTSNLGNKFEDEVRHLTPSHREFFQKWDELLTKEERDIVKFRRELWTMTSSERERLGRCFANVIIEPGSATEDLNAAKINRFGYTLIKAKFYSTSNFLESQMPVGEPVVISDENGHFALANGFVTHVGKKRVKVMVDRKLNNTRSKKRGFDSIRNQAFKGIVDLTEEGGFVSEESTQELKTPTLYRLDKDEFSNLMALARNNLLQLMVKDKEQSRVLRKHIIDLEPPSFNSSSTADKLQIKGLNIDQQHAIEKVMSANQYALILGMPGTGKTTTIAHIIRALVSQGKSVLLTSYTHTAVDNILLKIKDDNIRILRLGAVAKVHPEVQEFADLAGRPKHSIDELKKSYLGSEVVATTCLGVNHAVFGKREFDYCIVDEASQITLPVCLGPIRMAKKFILVGDHYQLPPLVQNKDAKEGGLDVSLFKLLSEKHSTTVVNLEHQYRMCEDVMALSNQLVYHGLLKCGNDAVAKRTLSVPNPDGLRCYHYTPSSLGSSPRDFCTGPNNGRCWINYLMDPKHKSCFVNTDALGESARDVKKGKRIINQAEASICNQLVRSLLTAGIQGPEIGVITVYRSQLSLLRHGLRDMTNSVEMHTADKFQGRDKEIIIVSLVRSNIQNDIGELLRDWRRVNVAFTRARSKLIILGSRSTMEGDPLMKKFVELMDKNLWTYDLPSNALTTHRFEEAITQADPSSALVPSPLKRKLEAEERRSSKSAKQSPKRGKMDMERFMKKRPILMDIVNEALG
ncbi:MAG: Tripartite DNA replication factor [Vezdaea aestivalis]|nr:MAG: Tripartite DNA replication factor [Vezdaea aestivalis]